MRLLRRIRRVLGTLLSFPLRAFHLCWWRLYAATVRETERRIRAREPPGPVFTLCLIGMIAFNNCFYDDIEHHLVFLSTTVYTISKMYEPNTAVMLINSEDYGWGRSPLRLRRALICRAANGTHTKISRAHVRWAYQPVGICKWTAYIALCPTLPNLVELSLTDTTLHARTVNIPFRMAYRDRLLEVAACFSPLFYMERWQIVLSTLEIYRHFGVQLQVFYIQSALAAIMEVMELYRQEGVAELEPWPSIELDAISEGRVGFDPNTELDWRNQASAHTDCLLKYKEATQFIIVGDLDDVLIPRMGARYIDEFRMLSSVYPQAAGFIYTRYNTELQSEARVQDYSLATLIQNARISDQNETGKYVVNTSRVETAWLHYPGIKSGWTQMFTVPTNLNIMVHLRNWTIGTASEPKTSKRRKRKMGRTRRQVEDGDHDERWKSRDDDGTTATLDPGAHATRMSDLVGARALERMQSGFARLLSAHADLFRALPSAQLYLPAMVRCYNRIFYSQRGRKPKSCPGPVRCTLPHIPGLHCRVARMWMAPPRQAAGRQKCMHPDIDFPTLTISWRIIVHVPARNFEFVSSHNGCNLR